MIIWRVWTPQTFIVYGIVLPKEGYKVQRWVLGGCRPPKHSSCGTQSPTQGVQGPEMKIAGMQTPQSFIT